MTRYYDIVLGLIPLAFGAVTAVLMFLGFGLTTAVPGASVVAVGLMGHAMFVNGPVVEGASGASEDGGYQAAD